MIQDRITSPPAVPQAGDGRRPTRRGQRFKLRHSRTMRKAFTTFELLAATALAAVLMVVVFQVIGSIGRTRVASLGQRESPAWKSDLLDGLRRDLTNSTGLDVLRDGGIVLTGHAALDRSTLAPVHEPVVVKYGLMSVHGRGWLYRRQWQRNGFSGSSPWQELLCPDVVAFSVRPAVSVTTPLVVPPATQNAGGVDEVLPPVPPAVVVRLEIADGRVWEETLVVR